MNLASSGGSKLALQFGKGSSGNRYVQGNWMHVAIVNNANPVINNISLYVQMNYIPESGILPAMEALASCSYQIAYSPIRDINQTKLIMLKELRIWNKALSPLEL